MNYRSQQVIVFKFYNRNKFIKTLLLSIVLLLLQCSTGYSQIGFEPKQFIIKLDFNGLLGGLTIDLNQDGNKDLLVHSNGRLGWYINIGNENFGDLKTLFEGNIIDVDVADLDGDENSTLKKLESIDVDNDGDLDVVCIGESDNKVVAWFENFCERFDDFRQ